MGRTTISEQGSVCNGPDSAFNSSVGNMSEVSSNMAAPRQKNEIVPMSFFTRIRTSLSPTKIPAQSPVSHMPRNKSPAKQHPHRDSLGGAAMGAEERVVRPSTPVPPQAPMAMQQLSPLSPLAMHQQQQQKQQAAASASAGQDAGGGEAQTPPATSLLSRLFGILPSPSDAAPDPAWQRDAPAAAPQHKVWRGATGPPPSQGTRDMCDAWQLSVQVTGASRQSQGALPRPFMAYALLVEVKLGGQYAGCVQFAVSRRFSRFVELHRQLSKDFPGITLPPFPTSQPFQSSVDPSVVGVRIVMLQKYLAALMSTPSVCHSEALYSFLELNAAAQIIVSAV
mmetsp:Transcript_27093/g.52816  ORF Transcript_27093/g.52816 Transcript_27093/m.52816 type:complete len:338 (+) Transcript_27093:61-1074(+)